MKRIVVSLAVIAVIGSAVLSHVSGARQTASENPTILYTVAKQYEPLAWMHGGERFPAGAQIVVREGNKTRPLVSGFAATADPNVSFDAAYVLFAGKKSSSDPWQVWEVASNGGTPKRIVSVPQDVIRPMYLPGGNIVYAIRRGNRFVIEVVPLTGSKALPVFYAPGSALPTDVLRDGRILFTATFPVGANAQPEIFTVYTDGSGVESYRCDHGHARYAARQLSSGDILFVEGNGLRRFTSALAEETAVDLPQADYAGDVVEIAGGHLLLSARDHRSKPFALRTTDLHTGKTIAELSEPALNIVQPVAIAPRPVPNQHPSGLHDWNYANLLALDSYTSRGGDLPRGTISQLRVFTRDVDGKAKLLGNSPVEKDGSFFIQVPGDQPLRFELVDASGRVIKKQTSWIWARSGEQRICVGCHAGPERAPENATPAVLQRSTVPVNLAGALAGSSVGGHRSAR